MNRNKRLLRAKIIVLMPIKKAKDKGLHSMHSKISANSPHVLILRLWREPRRDADTIPEWRALIEDVSNRRRYPVKDMTHLYALLAPYGEAMGLDDFVGHTSADDGE